MSSLPEIIHLLEDCRHAIEIPYFIPGLWIDGVMTAAVQVNPCEFYSRRLSEIAAGQLEPLSPDGGEGQWSRSAIIYNLFPRVTAAFDHNQDGKLEIRPDGWRETGSLLKCIALLPYIRDMGFNTVHLLPITAVGKDGKKGTLGSPYAIRNPYLIDPNLDEPAIGASVDLLFAGFVEAAHLLGMRVVLEFVLRTASKDSDWITAHPDWFYWIKADIPDRISKGTGRLGAYGSPIFPQQTLDALKGKVAAGDFKNLPPPPEAYQSMFTPPPRPEQISVEGGRYIGVLDNGARVRVPGAFTDWPPDDNQPPWSDVTYLRMYDDPQFNYIAYNTVRMYDEALARPEKINQPLWDAVAGVIPHYQRQFGIDGVMIDMGHALPAALLRRIVISAREINPDFAFWEENFSISQDSRSEGYNAVMGWWVIAGHEGDSMRRLIGQMAHGGFPISFFAAPENHNTARAASRPGGTAYAHYALALAITTPALPFILTGFELGETHPINTGLGFSSDQQAHLPPERLPLFSEWVFNWTRPDNLVKSVRHALKLRRQYQSVFTDTRPETFVIGYSDNPAILVFSRKKGDHWISIIANNDPYRHQNGRVVIDVHPHRVPGLWGTSDTGMDIYQETMANVTLSPSYVLILDGRWLPH